MLFHHAPVPPPQKIPIPHVGGEGGMESLVLLLLKKIRQMDCFVRKMELCCLGVSNLTLWHIQTVIYRRFQIKKEKAW